MITFRDRLFISAAAAVIALANTEANAQVNKSNSTELEIREIVVTAENRQERIQDLPIAISAFSGDTLVNSGVQDIKDLDRIAPSLQFNFGLTGNPNVTIRGIGSELSNIGAEPGVTISQDGVNFARSTFFNADMLDVDRVEVLRGPQGTISGRNATGGAIKLISRPPTSNGEAGIKLTVGNYRQFATEGFVSGPIIGDKLLGRIAFSTNKRNGWIKNALLDERIAGEDRYHVRGSLQLNVSDQLTALLILDASVDTGNKQGAFLIGRARPDKPSFGETFGGSNYDFASNTFLGD